MTRIYIELRGELAIRLTRDEPTGGRFICITLEENGLSVIPGGESDSVGTVNKQQDASDLLLHPRARTVVSEILGIDDSSLGEGSVTLSRILEFARRAA